MDKTTYGQLLWAIAAQHERRFRDTAALWPTRGFHRVRMSQATRAIIEAEAGHYPQRLPDGSACWLVPSEARGGVVYRLRDGDEWSCNCPTARANVRCWHERAVEVAELAERLSAEDRLELLDLDEASYETFTKFIERNSRSVAEVMA